MRRTLTAVLVVVLVLLVLAAADPAASAIAVTVGLLVGVPVWAWWTHPGRKVRGMPKPPYVPYVEGCKSGIYMFHLIPIDARTGQQTAPAYLKAGKATDLERRLSAYVTSEDRMIAQEMVVRTPLHDEVEEQIHADLKEWNLPSRGREVYLPSPEVRWYLSQFPWRGRFKS